MTQPTQYFCFSSAIQRLVYNSKLEKLFTWRWGGGGGGGGARPQSDVFLQKEERIDSRTDVLLGSCAASDHERPFLLLAAAAAMDLVGAFLAPSSD